MPPSLENPYAPPEADLEVASAAVALPPIAPGASPTELLLHATSLIRAAGLSALGPILVVFALASARVQLVNWLWISALMGSAREDLNQWRSPAAALGVLSTLFAIAEGGLVDQALIYALVERARTQRAAPLLASLGFGLRRLPRVFLARLGQGVALALGGCLLVVPAIYAYVRLLPLGPVVALEPRHAALGRAAALTEGHGYRVGVAGCVALLPYLGVGLVQVVVGAAPLPAALSTVVVTLAGVLASCVRGWSTAVDLAVYWSLRAEPAQVDQEGPPSVPWVVA